MKTENLITRNLERTFNKTIFIEYSSSKTGQHFMTVMQKVDGKRQTIGRIYRNYDKVNNKTTYAAVDRLGTPIFQDINDLPTLKRQFIHYGKSLTWTLSQDPSNTLENDGEFERELQVRDIRERNVDKKQEKGLER